MASISSAGIGSGLDVQSLVSQLVAAERAAPDTRIAASQTKAQTTLSAIGGFRSALAEFQNAAKALRDGGATKLTASSAKTELLTATASTAAAAGSYRVEVLTLAKAHKLATGAYGSSDTAVGHGTLTIGVGNDSFEVTVASDASSLSSIRDAINNASGNQGVRATLLNTTAGVRLTLTSSKSGEDGAITVASSGGDGGLSALRYQPGVDEQLQQVDPAQNATIEIDGYPFSSSSNVFAEAIDGVSFAVSKAEPGTVFGVSVALDNTAATAAVQNFVTRYNVLNAAIKSYSRYDATTQTGGPLLGDATVRALSQQVRVIMGSSVEGGTLQTLQAVGITSSADGSFKLDATKLATVLASDPAAVNALFDTEGIGGQIVKLTDDYLGTGGRIATKQDNLNQQLKDITKQQTALDRRMDRVEARYRAQFTALDTLISQLSSTSSYLTQQLAALPSNSSN